MDSGLNVGQLANDSYASTVPATLLQFLETAQVNPSLLTKLSRTLERFNLRLGDEVVAPNSNVSNLSQNSVQNEQSALVGLPDLYWICQGQVRILCAREVIREAIGESFGEPPRWVTAQLLSANEPFGADALLGSPLPYRAVAASPVQLVRLPAVQLPGLLEASATLREWLQQQVQQREQLIFFKSCTALRSLPSQQLRQLLPHLMERSIPMGSVLGEATPGHLGHFWLRQGTISVAQSTTDSTAQLAVPLGTSWGHPAPTPAGWIAQTHLRVYQVPPAAWDSLQLALPEAGTTATSTPLAEPAASPPPTRKSGGQTAVVRWLSQRPATPSPEPLVRSQPELRDIPFPKPLRRRLLDWLERYPWIEQQSSSDCGAACLAIICRYWGKQFPIHVLRERANVGREGASLKSLAKAAEDLGFHARPVRASLGRLLEQRHPWIAHWEGSHFVVVYPAKGQRLIVADPAVGRRVMRPQEFQSHWTGYALLLDPTQRLRQTEIKQASLGRYLSALTPYRSLILQVIVFSLMIQLFGLVTPLFTQIILDRVVTERSLTTLNVFALGLLLFGVWGICMAGVRQYLLSYFSNRLDLTLISGFISHTLTLPLKFFESRRVGDIITRVQENQKIQRFLVQQVVLAWLDFLTGFIYLGLMLYYNWQLTLLVLALIPPIVLLTLGSTPLLRQVSREIFKEAADQNSVLVEMMTGVATVKSAAAERELRWRWEDHLTSQMNAQFRGQKLGIGLQTMGGLVHSIGSTALLWFGATLVIQDQLTIGQFVAFNMMLGYVINPVISLANLWDELQEVLVAVERLNDVFEAQPEELPQQPLLVLPPIRGDVQFEDVTFRYSDDEERNTLQAISFSVTAGQMVAIVGRSGSGKSTLVKLLAGLYHATRGRVLIDGHDIRHVSPPSLRSQLGVVPQECFLFSGTILENIALYRPEFSLEEVIEVAKLAEAHAFIQALPLGYSTKVGERGSSLSGGQRQRIAIARALLGNPRLLILDEATSSLDTESERRFQRNLTQIGRDRTTFIIAHRLSTVRHADTILVLDRGVLVEQGNHDELMSRQGLYYHLAQQQLDL